MSCLNLLISFTFNLINVQSNISFNFSVLNDMHLPLKSLDSASKNVHVECVSYMEDEK